MADGRCRLSLLFLSQRRFDKLSEKESVRERKLIGWKGIFLKSTYPAGREVMGLAGVPPRPVIIGGI